MAAATVIPQFSSEVATASITDKQQRGKLNPRLAQDEGMVLTGFNQKRLLRLPLPSRSPLAPQGTCLTQRPRLIEIWVWIDVERRIFAHFSTSLRILSSSHDRVLLEACGFLPTLHISVLKLTAPDTYKQATR